MQFRQGGSENLDFATFSYQIVSMSILDLMIVVLVVGFIAVVGGFMWADSLEGEE